jgi:hypothetical protein
MIVISLHLWMIALGTWHIRTPFSLPAEDYKVGIGPAVLEITLGGLAPAQSRAIQPTGAQNLHPPTGTVSTITAAPEPASMPQTVDIPDPEGVSDGA